MENSAEKCPVSHLNPRNNMPELPNVAADPNQPPLSTEKTKSSIPDSSFSNWVYPSHQTFYNALLRKGYETPVEAIPTIVDIHNFINEESWKEIMKWESKECSNDVKLLRFQGRPKELSPRAMFLHWFYGHDWVIERCGSPVRYVIDYYSGPPEGDKPTFNVDVRPALDSFTAVFDRFKSIWGLDTN